MDSEPSSTQTGAHDISDYPPSSAIRLKWTHLSAMEWHQKKQVRMAYRLRFIWLKILFRRVDQMKLEELGIDLEKRCCSTRELIP